MTQPTSPPPPDPTDPTATARAVQLAVVLAVAAGIRSWIASGDDTASGQRTIAAVGRALRRLGRLGAALPRIITDAHRAGAQAAERQLPAAGRDRGATVDPERRTTAQAAQLVQQIEAAGRQVQRWAIQAHRDVLDQATRRVQAGESTRRDAAAMAWLAILDRGATGFVDRRGRRWELATYVEMSVRTATAQAQVQGHVDRLVAAGHTHVIVSVSPSTCLRCAPWAGKVLSLVRRGRHVVTLPSVLDGHPVRVEVAGSLAEAVDDGLFHPNCTHAIDAYIAGVTKPRRSRPEHVARGDQRDRQRHMERQVRRWKAREAASLTPADKAAAARRARQWQTALRDHVRTTGLRRKPERERINTPR